MDITVTPSLGVAAYPVDSRTKEGLLHLADEAMYLVKNTSRDAVAAANIGVLPALAADVELPIEDVRQHVSRARPSEA